MGILRFIWLNNSVMKRSDLIAAVKGTAEKIGYMFYTGNESALVVKAKEMPAVWLFPPVLKSVRGRAECRDTYGVKIRFLMMAPAGVGDTAALAAAVMEKDARSLIEEVERHPSVRRIGGVKIMPESKPSTPRGEIGMTVEFETEVFYYKYN